MLLPHGAVIAVVDGVKLHLYRNAGDDIRPALAAMDAPALHQHGTDAGKRHHSSTANPDEHRMEEDRNAAFAADWLNREVEAGHIPHLFVIAPPRTLGELRRHYSKTLKAKLLGDLARDLADHTIDEVQAAALAA